MTMQVTEADSDRPELGSIKQLSDGRPVSAPIVARFEPVEPRAGYPGIELEVDVHEGRIVVTKVTLLGSAESPLDSNTVRNYSLNVLAALAVRPVALKEVEPGRFQPDRSSDPWPSIVTAVRQRPVVDRPRLEEVAAAYRRGGIEAIKEDLKRSRSQAYRLKDRAVAAGLIGADEPPGRGEGDR